MYSIDIFVHLKPFDPLVPIGSQLTHMVYLLAVFALFSWRRKRFHLSDPDTTTTTTLEATASSSGNNGIFSKSLQEHRTQGLESDIDWVSTHALGIMEDVGGQRWSHLIADQ